MEHATNKSKYVIFLKCIQNVTKREQIWNHKMQGFTINLKPVCSLFRVELKQRFLANDPIRIINNRLLNNSWVKKINQKRNYEVFWAQ